MKFDPSWKQIALLALLFTAVIVAHRADPLSAQSVTSLASTIVGALFVNLRAGSGEAPAPAPLAAVPPPKEGGADSEGDA